MYPITILIIIIVILVAYFLFSPYVYTTQLNTQRKHLTQDQYGNQYGGALDLRFSELDNDMSEGNPLSYSKITNPLGAQE